MKKVLQAIAVLALGLGVGGGAAYGTSVFLGGEKKPHAVDSAFVPTGSVLAPLVLADGRLSGYVTFEVQLEVASDQAEALTQKLPLLLHAINVRTFRSPLASGPDGMLPNVEQFRRVVVAAAEEAFGSGVVRRVAITKADPS